MRPKSQIVEDICKLGFEVFLALPEMKTPPGPRHRTRPRGEILATVVNVIAINDNIAKVDAHPDL